MPLRCGLSLCRAGRGMSPHAGWESCPCLCSCLCSGLCYAVRGPYRGPVELGLAGAHARLSWSSYAPIPEPELEQKCARSGR